MAKFLQSKNDFPLTVSLGEKSPSWGLSRWGGAGGLRFTPLDDEGFTLRGDRRRLVYKGRRRSHRFTILSDGAFEYDVILNREPESNVIVLPMEGAEQYDFYRQPDFIKDPLLAGSYAVYKKETMPGEGTGKLCHIYRPEIIDARERRCWGDLSVVGKTICITIPEQWLSEAKYPVVVDPTVGTATVGSLTTGTDPNNPYYDRPWLDGEYALNKLYVPQNGRGLCTAFVYAYNADTENNIFPCLYTNVNNQPYKKKSKNENEIYVAVYGGYPAGWRNNTFSLDGDIRAGEYVWYGFHGGYFTTRFDYGGECYKGWFDWDTYPDYEGEPTPYMNVDDWSTLCNIKWSWYFTYTAFTALNYVRKITQGVKLTDTHKKAQSFKRTTKQTVKINIVPQCFERFYRKCLASVHANMILFRLPIFTRNILDYIKIVTESKAARFLKRLCVEYTGAFEDIRRLQVLMRKVFENANIGDFSSFPVFIVRTPTDTVSGIHVTRHFALYLRLLANFSGNKGETKHEGVFFRNVVETVSTAGAIFRGLIILVRLFSGLLIRDFFLGRFLKAREEVKLKSCISREIILDSKII